MYKENCNKQKVLSSNFCLQEAYGIQKIVHYVVRVSSEIVEK